MNVGFLRAVCWRDFLSNVHLGYVYQNFGGCSCVYSSILISWLHVYFCVRIMLSLSLWLYGIYWNQTFWYFQHGFFCLGLLLLVRVFCTFIDILAFSPSSMKNVTEFLWRLHWVCMFDIIVFFFFNHINSVMEQCLLPLFSLLSFSFNRKGF